MAGTALHFCLYLRTKNGYFRSPDGDRMIDPDSSTACYRCLLTQRPVGPDGLPCDARQCGPERSCFREENPAAAASYGMERGDLSLRDLNR